jgi:hypothetical protein
MAEAAYAEVLENPGQVLNEDDEDTDRNTLRLRPQRLRLERHATR